MKKINVLLLGGGGREHAIAWKLSQSERIGDLYIAPGNGGTRLHGTNLDIKETDFPAVKRAVVEHNVDLLVVGPEAPLVKGIREYIECDIDTEHVRIIGPGKEGAQLEGSKAFSKAFMEENNIPTAKYSKFDSSEIVAAKEFLLTMDPPYVLKADGLAGGKGVVIAQNLKDANDALDAMLLESKFGSASEVVVIEEFLSGIELSVFVLTDGKSFLTFPSAKDYKRIGEGDTGLNTGGMGSISPVPFADDAFLKKVQSRIIEPTLKGLRSQNIPYNGFIFIGLMNVKGDPYVIEYNCRMGDPETESIMPRIKSDLLEVLWDCGGENLATHKELKVSDKSVASIMFVAEGYPESYEKGMPIYGLESITDGCVFHAGTRMQEGIPVTSGGRVFTITSFGDSVETALSTAYAKANQVSFEGMYFRKDLGFDLK